MALDGGTKGHWAPIQKLQVRGCFHAKALVELIP